MIIFANFDAHLKMLIMGSSKNRINCVSCTDKSVCFEKLSIQELGYVDTKRVELNYKKGESISKQGSFATHILFVQQGLAKVYKEIDSKKDLILSIFPKGSLIGLPTLFNTNVAQYSVAAVEDTTICAIDKTVFEGMVLENSQFATHVISTINNCTFSNFNKILSLTQKQHNGRLAEALLFISDEIYKSKSFKLSLSRKDLAEFTGMSVISVVRILKEFNNDGIIKSSGKNIDIIDLKRLEQVSKSG